MKNFIILWMAVILSACGNNENSFSLYDEYAATPEMASDATISRSSTDELPVSDERKLIKEGYISFETNDLGKSYEAVKNAVAKYKGYISSDNESQSDYRKSRQLTVRIPSADFDVFLTDATQGVSSFDSKNIQIRDVTKDFVDVEARLKTKKELENRYRELLAKAVSVSDILSIEAQIGTLRADIEAYEGQLNYLKNQVAYSTLTIDFYTLTPQGKNKENPLLEAFKDGWGNFTGFLLLLVRIFPFILMLGLGIWVLIWFVKRKR
ncbi:MAG: DUF4349 domain-containing protein [Capnocytophaga sp.]|nr:DUF4349 domain-containing protein [Capnocytophaga sp.]